MIKILFGIFIVLHGLVHLLYLGQSARIFELQPGMAWPDGAWVLSRFLGVETTRLLANIWLALAMLVFIIGGIGLFASQDWWRPAVIVAAIFSTFIYVTLWNGRLEHLDNSGWVGILINLAILAAVVIFRWPR